MQKWLTSSIFFNNRIFQIIFIVACSLLITIFIFTIQDNSNDHGKIIIADEQLKNEGKIALQISENIVAIFSVSNKVITEQVDAFGLGEATDFGSVTDWICHNVAEDWQKNKKYLLIFPEDWNSTLAKMSSNLTSQCVWRDWKAAKDVCQQRLETMNSTRREFLWEPDIYEPKRDFNLKLLNALIKLVGMKGNECSPKNETKLQINIYIYTNFAERLLAKELSKIERKNSNLVKRIELIPLSIPVANYYHFALQNADSLNYYDQYFMKNIDDKGLNANWHQIYVFALSSNLTQVQLSKVVNAAKISIDAYFAEENAEERKKEPISVMYTGKFYLNVDKIMPMFCNSNGMYQIEICNVLLHLNIRDMAFDGDLIDHKNDQIMNITSKGIQTYFAKIYGARLPPTQIGDAIRPQMQPKPRIVLVTDFVEMKFLDSNIANENGFEFKVYALNNATFEHFQKRADKVIRMDPDSPGIIPFTRGEEEPDSPTMKPIIVVKPVKGIQSFLFLPITLGALILLTLMTIFIIISRRRLQRLNWLHRLEQFKTQHIYNAYLNEKRNSGKGKENVEDGWEIGWERVIMTNEQLGKGAFGEVRKGTLITKSNSSMEIAVKMLPMHTSEKSKNAFLREIKMMKLFGNGHQCVVKMLGCMSKGEGVLGIVLEFCPGGSLLDHLRKLKEENRQQLCSPFCRWAWQIADGMVFLAGKNLVHRDLAARNVLLDGNLIAKISDFGLCISLDEKLNKEFDQNKEKLPLLSLAPECIIDRRKFGEKSDVWSYGILLHEIYTFGQNPFFGIDFDKILEFICDFQPKMPTNCPEKIFKIMQKCMQMEMKERPGFVEIKEKLTEMLEIENARYGYVELMEQNFVHCSRINIEKL